jgi:NAD(P)-dependent dehydrogenase (short-subunit alcohol dehydrogenase family)
LRRLGGSFTVALERRTSGGHVMDQRVSAIVGAGDGLGQALAGAFANAGYDVALLSRTEAGSRAALDAARRTNGGRQARFFAADATRPQELESALRRVAQEMGRVDVLVYNPRGGLGRKPPLEIEYEELREIFELEVVGALAAAKAVAPGMIEAGRGTMLFSSATAAFRGSATNPLYSIGKFALRSLAQSLAKAYGKKGVHVVHVRLDCALDAPIVRKMMGARLEPTKLASTEDVARTYLWLTEQPRSAWTNEIELRPFTEEWTY